MNTTKQEALHHEDQGTLQKTPSSLNGKTWYHQKPAKRGLPTKTHIPGKEGINQRGSTETKGNSAGVAEL
ncbi:hypothetical protein CHARACLAT_033198 [Characodon lateralis]|uniref:Prolactin receptor n=1 Tax=Characodon lateralis TaxID=208331 RepID=A0ABU7EGD7_9TELE|nr:hypothetical protein [Characodon lateralis]